MRGAPYHLCGATRLNHLHACFLGARTRVGQTCKLTFMTTDDETMEHMLLGRAGLIRKRNELDALIADMGDMIVYLGGSLEDVAPVAPTSPPARPSADPPESAPRHPDASAGEPPTTREAVLGVLRAGGRTMSMSEIVAHAPEFGTTAQPDTIRSVLTKMVKSGVLERPSHGQYRLATPDCGDPEGESSTESTAGSPPDDEVSDPVPDQGVLGWANPPVAQRGVRTPSVA